MDKSSLQYYGVKKVDPGLPIEASYMLTTMPVDVVFRRESGWMMRRFSYQ